MKTEIKRSFKLNQRLTSCEGMHSEIAKIQKKVHCSGQRIVLILDTTSDLPESLCKILVENWLHSQVVVVLRFQIFLKELQ